MVGLVLVSHSRPLANAVADLVRRTVGPESLVATAGGVGEDRSELGTDALDIQRAIESLATLDGIVVLMDMGSAVLSAETALDLFSSAPAVRLCAAPFVEGAVAAAVQARLGSSLESVFQAARRSLVPKEEQLEPGANQAEDPAPGPRLEHVGEVLEVEVTNPHGLHLRPVSRLLATLSPLDVQVTLQNVTMGGQPVPADSLVEISRLQLRRGHMARFVASGPDASRALVMIRELAQHHFGEDEVSARPGANPSGDSGRPLCIAPGTAFGRRFVLEGLRQTVSRTAVPELDVSSELAALQDALDRAGRSIQARAQAAAQANAPGSLATILYAQRLILEDRSLRERARNLVREEKRSAAAAWLEATDEMAQHQAAASDPYLRQRAADFREAGELVLQSIPGLAVVTAGPRLPDEPFVLVCEELSPSMFDQVRSPHLQGIVQFAGGPNSHGAILARAAGIPCLGGTRRDADRLQNAEFLAFDGRTGELWFDPPTDVLGTIQERRGRETRVRASWSGRAHEAAITRDGVRVEVYANVSTAGDIADAALAGADGIGLFRTEILFQQFVDEPDEDAQLRVCAQALASWDDRPVTVRLLDIGGDKPLPFLQSAQEANPFLGVRGIRLLLRHRAFLGSHLRALLQLANRAGVSLLVPMVTDGHELSLLSDALAQAHRELTDRGIDHRWPVAVGVMVETPASAVMLTGLAMGVRYLSIGTNDLTQYVLATERGHPELLEYQDGLHPALIRVLHRITAEAEAASVPVSLCGELAADPEAVPILVGLGLKSLSVAPGSLPKVKEAVRHVAQAECRRVVEVLLSSPFTRGTDVRELIRQRFAQLVLADDPYSSPSK